MKQSIIFLMLILLLKLFLPVPPYIECNHLSIITKIVVRCDSFYDITYYETNPIREDNGIKYHSKKYHIQSDDLVLGIHRLESNKYIYKKKAKILVYCPHKNNIISKIKKN